MKDLRLLFILILTLLCASLVSCGGGPEPSTESPEQPAMEQSDEAAAPAPEADASTTPSADEVTPCKIVNVDDATCTNALASSLTDILISQGESEDAAKMAGSAIAEAIQKAPVDKRNGFKMRGLESGKEFSFLFQKVKGICTLQLFGKVDGDNYSVVTSRSLPDCSCED